jgi:ABC-type transport system substrate-binding protein
VEIRAVGDGAFQEKALFATADCWSRVGLTVDPVIFPRQRQGDREYRRTFPAFEQPYQPTDLERLRYWQSAEIPLPENGYIGRNYPRYQNSTWDALIDRYFSTVPIGERNQALAAIMHHLTTELPVMPLFYAGQVSTFSPRMVNGTPAMAEGSGVSWNAHEWDVK